MTGESGDPGSEADVPTFVICVENNKFQPENWWNGRWRSEFSLSLGRTQMTFHRLLFAPQKFNLVHCRFTKVH